MSFSSDVKNELSKIDAGKMSDLKAECYGVWLFSKCYTLKESSYTNENAEVIRKMAELAAVATGVSTEISYTMSRRKKPAYRISIPDENGRKELLACFGNDGTETSLRINRANLEEESCYAAFIRGAFLSCGTVTDPNKEYHFELATPHRKLAEGLLSLMGEVEEIELSPAVAERQGNSVVYLKDSSQIEDILTYMGATSNAMELMQIKMYKETINNINRKANFETANMDKTYSASAKQTAAIARIVDGGVMQSLPEELREIASIRLENPEMTLGEMAKRLHISRSGANHRLKRLCKIAEELIIEED